MTIVVTGASGNVGRPLVSQLSAAGARVRAVTRAREWSSTAPSDEFEALAGRLAVFRFDPVTSY